MAYVESFKRAMERARQSVSYWDHKTLDHLQDAHDAEMRQCSKAEFHRGFEDGKAARDADQWQLELQRKVVAERLRKVVPSELHGSHEMLSAICKAISEPVMGWTVGAGELLRDQLIALLGGTLDARNATNFAGNRQNGPKSGEKQPEMQRDVPESRDSLQEVQSQSITGEQREYADDYCYRGHFSTFKNMAYPMPWDNPAETSEDANGTASNNDRTCPIAVQSQSITDELRKFAETFRYEWYDEKDGSVCYTTSDYPPSLDSICMSDYVNAIADRIDAQFERICSQHESVLQQTISETVDERECEMDELRADYEQAISDITGVERGEGSDLLMPVDVFLHVRDTLRHDVEMWRDRAEDMRMERDDLRAELRVANQTHECNRKLAKRNEQWCDELLDLIRDAASEYQECQRLLRVFKCHAKDIRRERDDLQDRLQAISVLCEQDDD